VRRLLAGAFRIQDSSFIAGRVACRHPNWQGQPTAGRRRFAAVPFRNRKFRIQNSRFKIRGELPFATNRPTRAAACGGHAGSGTNCRPPIQRATLYFFRSGRTGSPQSSGWSCLSAMPPVKQLCPNGSKFKIQNYCVQICPRRFPAETGPQPSGWACDFRGAALRPGAAAGSRSLRDRFCQQAFPP